MDEYLSHEPTWVHPYGGPGVRVVACSCGEIPGGNEDTIVWFTSHISTVDHAARYARAALSDLLPTIVHETDRQAVVEWAESIRPDSYRLFLQDQAAATRPQATHPLNPGTEPTQP